MDITNRRINTSTKKTVFPVIANKYASEMGIENLGVDLTQYPMV
jgi:hypothetical protein